MVRHFFPLTQEKLDEYPNKKLDIHYCDEHPLQVMDLYYPDEESGFSAPYPVIVHTHGGGFANGDQRDTQLLPMLTALKRGYVVVSIQYRRSREALFPAQLYDVKAAVRYLRAHANDWDLDPNKFAAWGASSGGWLASMLGLTSDIRAFEDPDQGNSDESSAVQAVIDWCGPCGNFLEMDRAFQRSGLGEMGHSEADSPESRFLGHQITEIPELVRMVTPAVYAHTDMPPVYILHGSIDQVVPVEQSIAFADAIKKAAGTDKVQLHIVEGKLHHGDAWYNEPWVANEALDFLDKVFQRTK
ncbi:MAG: alpha/beta hydrolase [Eubacteriales bacterium]|nr:alpha/beta hydrolase [Eubacteriales bacterium]